MKTINMLIGLPSIGKSTFVRQEWGNQPHRILSTDSIREELTGDEANTRKDKQMWALMYDRFEKALNSTAKKDNNIILDATFLDKKRRTSFFDIIRDWGENCLLNVFTFPVDPKLAIERQKGRERKVPNVAIYGFAKRFQPFTADEASGINHQHIQLNKNNQRDTQKAS